MRRTEVLQGLREMKFDAVYERFRRGRLSLSEATDCLGVSERTFRRWRGRYDSDGVDGLLGKMSPHRIGEGEVDRIVALYRVRYGRWTVRHFHDRAGERVVPVSAGSTFSAPARVPPKRSAPPASAAPGCL